MQPFRILNQGHLCFLYIYVKDRFTIYKPILFKYFMQFFNLFIDDVITIRLQFLHP